MSRVRRYIGFWLPPIVALTIGAILGAWAGDVEVRACLARSELYGLGLRLWSAFLFVICVGLGLILVALLAMWLGRAPTLHSVFGVLLGVAALPATFYVVTATIMTAACGGV